MKDRDTSKTPIPAHDYGAAVQKAVSWLGDRYLLAEPQPRREEVRPIYVREPPAPRAARPRAATRH